MIQPQAPLGAAPPGANPYGPDAFGQEELPINDLNEEAPARLNEVDKRAQRACVEALAACSREYEACSRSLKVRDLREIQAIDVEDLPNLQADDQTTQRQLKDFNVAIRKIEAMYDSLNLETRWDKLPSEKQCTAAQKIERVSIKKTMDVFKQTYAELQKVKAEFVRSKFKKYNGESVYAMAIPSCLKRGDFFYHANELQIIESHFFDVHSAKEESFLEFQKNPNQPATYHSQAYKVGVWGGNLLGELGYYFSTNGPVYLVDNGRPNAISVRLIADHPGVTVPPVTELVNETYGFSPEQVEEGYLALQRQFPYLRHEGLGGFSTELTLLNPQGKYELQDMYYFGRTNAEGERACDLRPNSYLLPIDDYYRARELRAAAPTPHPSWKGIIVRDPNLVQAQAVAAAPAVAERVEMHAGLDNPQQVVAPLQQPVVGQEVRLDEVD